MDSLFLRLYSAPRLHDLHFPKPSSILSHNLISSFVFSRYPLCIHALKVNRCLFMASALSDGAGMLPKPSNSPSPSCAVARNHLPLKVFHVVVSTVLFVCFSCASVLGAPLFLPTTATISSEISSTDDPSSAVTELEDEEFRAAFEQWKSKIFALTVSLRIVALRSSVPPSWIKDFVQAQGRRLKLSMELRGSLESIYSEMTLALDKYVLEPKSAMSADLISLGDSWLSDAIRKGLIEPIPHVKDQDWFKSLCSKWKEWKRRLGSFWLHLGNSIPLGHFVTFKDWNDLWRPELTGKISMIDSPREVIGAVLKRMGASYNTQDIESQVIGGRESVLHFLLSLQKQVRYFDSVHYLKAFGGGDSWVAVGWSSDVIPAAKRMADVAVVIPKSGSSIWADLWAIPAATKFNTDRIGGRVRGPSPLIHQWIDFCLQASRSLPFRQEVIPGASPFSLELFGIKQLEPDKGKPKLDTNLVEGVPPPEILEKCEFLEPLSDKALEDYQWLISSMHKPHCGIFRHSK